MPERTASWSLWLPICHAFYVAHPHELHAGAQKTSLTSAAVAAAAAAAMAVAGPLCVPLPRVRLRRQPVRTYHLEESVHGCLLQEQAQMLQLIHEVCCCCGVSVFCCLL